MTSKSPAWVVDASVAAKWFMPETDSELALQLIQPHIRLLAPEFLYAELGSVFLKRLARGDITHEECSTAFRKLDFMTVDAEPAAGLVADAYRIALETGRSFYDCLYLALAVRREVPLITEDQRFWNAIQSTRYAECVVRLQAIPA